MEDWKEKIFREIDVANSFLFVVSPESLESVEAKQELDHAALNNKRMIPIFYRKVPSGGIPEALGRKHGIDFSNEDQFDASLTKLLDDLGANLVWIEAHTRLLTRAKEWEREGRESSLLLRGKDLREAERWVAKSGELNPKLTSLQSEYVVASRQAATKTQRVIFGAIAVAALSRRRRSHKSSRSPCRWATDRTGPPGWP